MNHFSDIPDNFPDAALHWFRFGVPSIPINPETKQPSVYWQQWLDGLTEQKIRDYWKRHPQHHVGMVVDSRFFIIDADSPKSLAALIQIEKSFDVVPSLVNKTSKGEHHFFKKGEGTFAKMASFSTNKFPENLDIRTGRTLTEGRSIIILPPSTGKENLLFEAETAGDLSKVNQDFIDAVFAHNGDYPPRELQPSDIKRITENANSSEAAEIISYISPDCGYQEWVTVGMALHSEFNGSEEGLQLFDSWSSGSEKYPGSEEIEYKWRSFHADKAITLASACKMAADAGADLSAIARKHQFGATVTPAAQKLADYLHDKLIELLAVDSEENPEEAESVKPDAGRIARMINGAFWSGGKSKLFLLNHDEQLVVYTEKDAFKFLARTFGNAVDRSAVETLAAKIQFDCGDSPKAQEAARMKHVSYCMGIVKSAIIDHLKYHNQRESIEWRVDMFGKFSRMKLIEDKARIVLTHKEYEEPPIPNQYLEIVDDYKQHFTRFDEFLMFLVCSRFAIDRKKSYLWILATSDWGKGFLMGMLKQLSACVETSMREVETMLEGKPVGRSAEDFKRSIVLLIDEFKTVKSELKQLQSEITLSPKNQLCCTVEIFAKVFTSAESVASLVGENGVEDQFANRMSIFEEHGDITKRPLFQQVDNARYFRAVLAYTARFLNNNIKAMQRLGREAAESKAERWLDDFIKKYGLDTKFERFSETLPALASEMSKCISDPMGIFSNDSRIIRHGHDVYLTSTAKIVDEYIDRHFSHSEVAAIRKKKTELYALMSDDGRGVQSHRIDGDVRKAIKLKL